MFIITPIVSLYQLHILKGLLKTILLARKQNKKFFFSNEVNIEAQGTKYKYETQGTLCKVDQTF